MEGSKRKTEKAEDFVGWISPDGKLKVVGIIEKSRHTKFKVECSECSKDTELFPNGYFSSTKTNLLGGGKPCGCARSPKWKDWQFLILAKRVGEKKNFIVHGFSGDFHGNSTKVIVECIKDGYIWEAPLTNLLSYRSGCKKCSKKYTPTEQEAINTCAMLCKEINYKFIGFTDGYKTVYSKFEYICPKHGKHKASYTKFVKSNNRCPDCAKEITSFNGYFLDSDDKQDFLYVLNFGNRFIKIGRSFDVDKRIKTLKKVAKTNIGEIVKLNIFTAKHREVYTYEQNLLHELRKLGLQHVFHWSKETFKIECLPALNKLLTECSFERVPIE